MCRIWLRLKEVRAEAGGSCKMLHLMRREVAQKAFKMEFQYEYFIR